MPLMRKTSFLSLLFLLLLSTACWHKTGNVSYAERAGDSAAKANSGYNKNATPHYTLTDSLLLQRMADSHTPSQILVRKGYVASYNKDTKCPNWVAWRLTRSHADGNVKRPNNAFHADCDVPQPRVQWYDYKGSGYTRGHLCPAGDNKWNEEAMWETFLMTNVVPQDRTLNDGDWNEIESRCRQWARKYGDIYIVSGPLPYKKPWNTIGERGVVVPKAMFKVVLCLSGKKPQAIGFVCKNTAQNKPISTYVNSLKEVERLTGINFFPSLPKSVREQIENKADIDDWKVR